MSSCHLWARLLFLCKLLLMCIENKSYNTVWLCFLLWGWQDWQVLVILLHIEIKERKIGLHVPQIPPTTLLLTLLPKSHSPITMEMSHREKRAHHSHHHHCHRGQCAHHPLLWDGVTSWEHSQLYHGNRQRVLAAGMFYNHPEPFCPKYTHKVCSIPHSAVQGCHIKDLATTTKSKRPLLIKHCIHSKAVSKSHFLQIHGKMSYDYAVQMVKMLFHRFFFSTNGLGVSLQP